jgi:hypothetical protein
VRGDLRVFADHRVIMKIRSFRDLNPYIRGSGQEGPYHSVHCMLRATPYAICVSCALARTEAIRDLVHRLQRAIPPAALASSGCRRELDLGCPIRGKNHAHFE